MIQKKRSRYSLMAAIMVAATFAASGLVKAEPVSGELGSYLYSEPSDETRAEVLDLLNTGLDSTQVFLQGLSLGLPIDELLQASIRNDSDNGQTYLNSASGLLSKLSFHPTEEYSTYSELSGGLTATEVIDRFFSSNSRLAGNPDWQVGEHHMMVPVTELQGLVSKYNDGNYWFLTDNESQEPSTARPVFIQLYNEHDYAIIGDATRINRLSSSNPSVELPVVFVFNGTRERPISQIEQPATVQNVVSDYRQFNMIATPPPEWSLREYHALLPVQSLDDYFTLPTESDIPADTWASLTNELVSKGVHDSFIVTILPEGGEKSAILNRPDRLAAAKALGISEVPVSYFYADQRRMSPYTLGSRGLANSASQAGLVNNLTSSFGGVAPSVAGLGGLADEVVEPIIEPPVEPITEPVTTSPAGFLPSQ